MEVNRSDALLSVYAEISAEIARLRDNEFRTAFLSLALNAEMIAVFTNDRVATRAGALERWAAIVISSIIVAVLIFYLLVTHHYLTEHRTIRRRIERTMDLHKPDVYQTEPLFPTNWSTPFVTFRFQALGVVVPLIMLMVAFQAGTILLIVRATG